jgi:transposase
VVVLNNATFLRPPSLLALVEATGCRLMLLPAYSPDLNPIEHIWVALKVSIRRGLQEAKDKFLFISNMCLCYC